MFSWAVNSSASRKKTVEQQAECGERLTTVLHGKAKQHDSAGT
jgi:hypothetical protein